MNAALLCYIAINVHTVCSFPEAWDKLGWLIVASAHTPHLLTARDYVVVFVYMGTVVLVCGVNTAMSALLHYMFGLFWLKVNTVYVLFFSDAVVARMTG